MKKLFSIILCLAIISSCFAGFSIPSAAYAADEEYRTVAYITPWNYNNSIDITKLTNINFAFVYVYDDYVALSSDGANALSRLVEKRNQVSPDTKISISVMQNQPTTLCQRTQTQEARTLLISQLNEIVTQYSLDGIDYDWEFPGINNSTGATHQCHPVISCRDDFTALLRETRTALSDDKLLTIACGAGNYGQQYTDFPSIVPYLDYINVMAYDFNWGKFGVAHQSNLYAGSWGTGSSAESCNASIELLLSKGVPAKMLNLGVPFYAYHQGGTADTAVTYATIKSWLNNGTATLAYDETAKQSYLSASPRGTVAFDDPVTIGWKAEYVKEKGLGGIMIWEAGQDDSTGTLLTAVWEGLKANQEPQEFASGTGTADDPYIIMTAEQLNNVRHYAHEFFKLGADIDLTEFLADSENGWEPIGKYVTSDEPTGYFGFAGYFDGDGHTISGLWINSDDEQLGLFGSVAGGEIKNVNIVLDNEKGGIKGKDRIGGLVGYLLGGDIIGCSVVGDITSTHHYEYIPEMIYLLSDTGGAGGLIGESYGNVSRCYTYSNVSSQIHSGGLIGIQGQGGSVSESYSCGSVSSLSDGGLIGFNKGDVIDCYSIAAVSSQGAGGLIGYSQGGTVTNCYAAGKIDSSKLMGGGIIACLSYLGDDLTTVTDCYFDTETTALSQGIGEIYDSADWQHQHKYADPDNTGRNTEQMKQQSTFENWDFENVWGIYEDSGYPYLRAFGNDILIIPETLSLSELSYSVQGNYTEPENSEPEFQLGYGGKNPVVRPIVISDVLNPNYQISLKYTEFYLPASTATFKVGHNSAFHSLINVQESDLPFLIENGRAIVPMRIGASILGARDVIYDEENQSITIVLPDRDMAVFTIGSSEIVHLDKHGAEIERRTLEDDMLPRLVSGKAYLPARVLSQIFSGDIYYKEVSGEEFVVFSTVQIDESLVNSAIESAKSVLI